MPTDREPNQEELMAMAYADGELSLESRREFEARMQRDGALARMVAEHQALNLLARHAAPAEPVDSEWNRLRRDPVLRGAQGAGSALLVAGSLGLAGYGIARVWSAEMSGVPKALLLAVIAGLLLLFLGMVYARLATLPYDPYRNIKR